MNELNDETERLKTEILNLKSQLLERDKIITDKDNIIENKNKIFMELLKEKDDIINQMTSLIQKYEEQLALSKVKRFGKSTEKADCVLDEVEEILAEETREKKNPGKKQGSKNFNHKESNAEREIIDIALPFLACPNCNNELRGLGFESSEKIEIIPAKVIIRETRYHKGVCEKCHKIHITEKKPSPFPNTLLSASLASSIITDKYLLHVPLDRQESYYKSYGIPLSKQTMSNYVMYSYNLLKPLLCLMKETLIKTSSEIIHSDDTTLKVIHKKDKDRDKCYMWHYSTSRFDIPVRLYDYQMTRSSEPLKEYLNGFKGKVICDGYSAYNKLEPEIKVCGCWAHARRKYTDLIKTLTQEQKKKSKAVEILKIIDEMFDYERLYREINLLPDEILKRRSSEIRPLLSRYESLIFNSTFDENSLIGKAVNYSKNIWDKLIVFMEDGKVEMTNNQAERGIKPFVIGRKNFLFSNTENGARASALLYSLVETAKANLINVEEYLKYVIDNISEMKQSELKDLLPWKELIQKLFSIKR